MRKGSNIAKMILSLLSSSEETGRNNRITGQGRQAEVFLRNIGSLVGSKAVSQKQRSVIPEIFRHRHVC